MNLVLFIYLYMGQCSFCNPSNWNNFLLINQFSKSMLVFLVVVCVIFIVVFNFLLVSVYLQGTVLDWQNLETFWTLLPVFLLFGYGLNSFCALYAPTSTSVEDPVNYIKAIGHQWYWSFESDTGMDVYVEDSESKMAVNNKFLVNVDTFTRIVMTSYDVIHSFYSPEHGIKLDCIPGRINEDVVLFNVVGSYMGFCTELCGQSHSMMPFQFEVVL